MINPQSTDDSVDGAIAARISNALIVKNTSVRHLSEVTGISYPTLRRSLAGGRSLTFSEFGRIASALGVASSSLLPDTLTGSAA